MTPGTARTRTLIVGAAGRDFHNFNVVYREDPAVEVVAFTAAQIPGIGGRRYPSSLAGPLYPEGIPVVEERDHVLPRVAAARPGEIELPLAHQLALLGRAEVVEQVAALHRLGVGEIEPRAHRGRPARRQAVDRAQDARALVDRPERSTLGGHDNPCTGSTHLLQRRLRICRGLVG